MKFVLAMAQKVRRIGCWSAKLDGNRVLITLVVAASTWTVKAPAATAQRLPVFSVSASADDGNLPIYTLDGSLATRWSASGDGQWIRYDLGSTTAVGSLRLAWHKGNLRSARFDVQTSVAGTTWTTVFTGQSSGSTTTFEAYDVSDSSARYVRIVGHGTSQDLWNSLCETEIYGPGSGVVPRSDLHLTLSRSPSLSTGPTVSLWNSVAGATYLLEVSSNRVNWVDTGFSFTGGSSVQTWQDNLSRLPAARTMRFYRVKQGSSAPQTNNLPTIVKASARLPIGNGSLLYWRNRPLDAYDPRVTRAIIVIHGSGANAEGYFDRMNNVIPSTWGNKVMVIAPHFQEEAEASGDDYWWDGDWREGGASGGLSSYQAVDKVVELMRNGTFPNLKWIVIGGHSAGGQFTQRYAAFTDIDLKSTPNSQYVKFVPANPSSYVYLNEYRRGANNTWVVPGACSSGDGYNEWKYGLDGLYGYSASRGAAWARTHLPRRWVELLAGTYDNVVDDGLDLDCAAMRQGEKRFDRAQNFDAFMDRFYPSNNFSLTFVPEVGHDSALIFSSPEGRNAYFFAD